jgi:8-hydroxy-5-deazaflavin:NADPH oxidoreductase
MTETPALAVIGGTGALGMALAWRLARAGHDVVVGSRSMQKAQAAASQIRARIDEPTEIKGMDNAEAAACAELIFVTVPFASHQAILADIKAAAEGKIVVDATVPLMPPKVATFQAPPQGSAALAAQAQLGGGVTVVSALQNVAAHKLGGDADPDCDVLVCSNQLAARQQVIDILKSIGLRGIHAGALANSVAAEALTSILIGINKRYKVDGAGIRITGQLIDPSSV